MTETDWAITGEELTVRASETVSTGNYESAEVSVEYEASVEGADFTDGVPRSLRERVYHIQRQVQTQVKEAAEARKEETGGE